MTHEPAHIVGGCVRSIAHIAYDELPETFARELLVGSADYVRDQFVEAWKSEREVDMQKILRQVFGEVFEGSDFFVELGPERLYVHVHFTDFGLASVGRDKLQTEFVDQLFLWLASVAKFASYENGVCVVQSTDAAPLRDTDHPADVKALASGYGLWEAALEPPGWAAQEEDPGSP